jgi:hypothetical protein
MNISESELETEIRKRFKPKMEFISLFGSKDIVNEKMTYYIKNNTAFILGQIQFKMIYDNGFWSDTITINSNSFDDEIDEWHNSDSELTLYEYLGLTKKEYEIWLKEPHIVEKHFR